MKRIIYKIIDTPISYSEGLALQHEAVERVKSSDLDGILLLLQHKPVFSVGKAGGAENILYSEEYLNSIGIEVHKSDRGGNVTYHGPGQLVGYPILNLKKFNPDVHWYFERLEETLIKVLSDFKVDGGRKPQFPGVWVEDKKIAAIGVHISRWITTHGFALNVAVNKDHFALINPCGIKEFGIISLDDLVESTEMKKVIDSVILNFGDVFEAELIRE